MNNKIYLGIGQPASVFADEDGVDLGREVRRVWQQAGGGYFRLRNAASEDRNCG